MPAYNTFDSILYAHQQVKDWENSSDYWIRRRGEERVRGNHPLAESLGRSLDLAREQVAFWRERVELRLAARAASFQEGSRP